MLAQTLSKLWTELSVRPDGPSDLRQRLRHVYWIGGGSGSGKSTIAKRLADEHGLHVYATDAVMADHAERGTAEDCPHLQRFRAMSIDERWLHRSPDTMLSTFHWFLGEGFDAIVDDLLQLEGDRPLLVEGFRLLPRLVRPLLATSDRAVWLLPTPAFREAAFAKRGWGFLERTSDPELALANLLERDRMFTERVRAETQELGLSSIDVDAGLSEDDLVGLVAAAFGV